MSPWRGVRRTARRRELRATAFWLVVLLLAAGGWLWWTLRSSPPGAPGTPAPSNPGPPAGAQPVRVDFPLDGDSLQVTAAASGAVLDVPGAAQLRLLGIDAPELPSTDGGPQCWADTARAELRRLAPPGAELWVLPDTERRDPYQRYLVYAWTADGRFVNAELAARGAVRERAVRPNLAHQRGIHDAVAAARAQRRGLWGSCEGT
ncbi:thermonuclease family protein [Catellatospora sp. NPDC049609]|uniref:thermonuclease family protein n=1 Tax=Catellatospora sp. NPDC049609 TaxID=3155505 RepID=UPI0034465081